MRTGIPLLVLALLTGCAHGERINPSFSITARQASAAMSQMRQSPKPLKRPLVILGGFSDPIGANLMRQRLSRLFDDDRIISVSFMRCHDFEQCRQRVIHAVDKAFGIDDATRTVEVDVIGISMGGLVARLAAEPDDQYERRLHIARLFTISSPLQGAKLANFPIALTSMHRDMRAGSELLHRLNEHAPEYVLYAYTRLDDSTVGEEFAAPVGQHPWWLDTPPFQGAHFGAATDKRILADIARRLRDEEPYATHPPAPLPEPANSDEHRLQTGHLDTGL